MNSAALTINGTAFHTPRRGDLEILEDCLIQVGDDGRITEIVETTCRDHEARRVAAASSGTLVSLNAGQYLVPGMVDLHIHAPQWAQMGKALDAPLEDWLQKYTFPLEARFSDIEYARGVYQSLVSNLLANGTTTAVYFGTIHNEATLVLAEECLRQGQRALVGRVAMDEVSQSPDFYRDQDAAAAVESTRDFINRLRNMQGDGEHLVLPVVTPRFIPTSTDGLLGGLGKLAKEYGCHVQTHCSESDWEVAHVRTRFDMSDARILDHFNLLTDKTILAHSNFVSPEDLDFLRDRGSAVAHCPLSNAYFANAVFPLRAALDKSVKVGLGTDISAGYSPSLFDSARSALVSARLLASGVDPSLDATERGAGDGRISIAEAFWLATAAGGDALGLPVGRFAAGCYFDALLLDTRAAGSNVFINDDNDTSHEVFEKIVLHTARCNIMTVWVRGRGIESKGAPA